MTSKYVTESRARHVTFPGVFPMGSTKFTPIEVSTFHLLIVDRQSVLLVLEDHASLVDLEVLQGECK